MPHLIKYLRKLIYFLSTPFLLFIIYLKNPSRLCVQVRMRVYLVVCVFLLMDCLSEGSTSASYGSLKHLLTSHVPCAWSYHSESHCKRVNPSPPDHFVGGQRVCSCDSLLFDTTSVGCSLIHHRVHIAQLSCRRWQCYRGKEINGLCNTPSTQLLWPWCFSSSSGGFSYMSTLTVPSCLQEVTYGGVTSLPYLRTTHTPAFYHLSSLLFTLSGETDLAGVLCDDHNHFSVSFILPSASILISL